LSDGRARCPLLFGHDHRSSGVGRGAGGVHSLQPRRGAPRAAESRPPRRSPALVIWKRHAHTHVARPRRVPCYPRRAVVVRPMTTPPRRSRRETVIALQIAGATRERSPDVARDRVLDPQNSPRRSRRLSGSSGRGRERSSRDSTGSACLRGDVTWRVRIRLSEPRRKSLSEQRKRLARVEM
jgi:hypothetical protein